jgi:hypothetical protein
MDFRFSERAAKLTSQVRELMNEEVIPNEERYRQEITDSGNPFCRPPVMEELRSKAFPCLIGSGAVSGSRTSNSLPCARRWVGA